MSRLRCDQTPAWAALRSCFEAHGKTFDLREAFATDPERFAAFSQEAPHVFADLSKNLIDTATLEADFAGGNGLGEGDSDSALPGGVDAFVLYEQGRVEQRVVHDLDRVEARRAEREMQLMAQRYAVYAQNTAAPMPFEKFVDYMRRLTGGQ